MLLNIDKFYSYFKEPFESTYQLLINGREKVGSENLKNPKTFFYYSQTIYDVYENLEDDSPTKKIRVLIVFDGMIAYMNSNKKLSHIVTELFSKGRKLTILLVFISKYYFKVPETIRLNAAHFNMKILNKRERQPTASNHSSVADFKDFMKRFK